MAIAIVDVLRRHGSIEEDRLAEAFAARFAADPSRGYGPGAVQILERISGGLHWRPAAATAFGGLGSMGNGSAMRVAPLGAYFATTSDDWWARQFGRRWSRTLIPMERLAPSPSQPLPAGQLAAEVSPRISSRPFSRRPPKGPRAPQSTWSPEFPSTTIHCRWLSRSAPA